MPRKSAIIGLLVATAVGWLWLSPPGLSPAPPVTLTTLDGKQIELQSMKGKAVLVNFWATTCPSCVKEMPDLMTLQRDFAPKGFTVIGIAMPYDRPDQVLRMTRERGFNFPIALDPSGDATRAFGGVSLTPTSFLIAPDGRIAQTVIGELEFDALRSQLRTWLGS